MMVAIKENNSKKQDYLEMVRYLVENAGANVNLQAEKANPFIQL